MRVLGIETTCDETAAAVVTDGPGRPAILSNEVMSQIAAHAPYGGVVPEIAARAHIETIDRLIRRALEVAGVTVAYALSCACTNDFDGPNVTDLQQRTVNMSHELVEAATDPFAAAGPGLIGGVLVGLTAGKAIALAAGKPFIGVNHLEGHALTARLTDGVAFPYLLLLVSGGHTQLVAVRGIGQYERLGTTVDDAVGEAFDKVAKTLGLPYPGGPQVEIRARTGDPTRFAFPRPMVGRPEPNFSLSGLKTAVRLQTDRLGKLGKQDIDDVCASFQAAVIDVLDDRIRAALRRFRASGERPNALVVAGGVAANQAIRHSLSRLSVETGVPLIAPAPELCTDNGAMIAWAGLEHLRLGRSDPLDFPARPRWPLDQSAVLAPHGKA